MDFSNVKEFFIGNQEVIKVKKNGINLWEKINYKPLKYIQCTGTQYINTGIIGTNFINMELDFEYISGRSGSWIPILGERPTNDFSKKIAFWIAQDTKLTALNYGNYDSGAVSGYYANTRIKLRNDKGKFYYNNTQIASSINYTFNSNLNIYLFALNTGSSADIRNTNIKFYNLKLWDNYVLVRDFVPAMDDNNVVCLYDKVTETYFYNSGTGTFLYE